MSIDPDSTLEVTLPSDHTIPEPWQGKPASTINALTGIRFIAAMLIVVYHFFPYWLDGAEEGRNVGYISRWISSLAFCRRAHLMVDLFFVLSGFVMAHVYASSIISHRFNYRSYLIKRLARLYPLHIAVLFAYVAIWLACLVLEINPRDPGKYDIAALPQNLLLIHAWGTTPALSWNAPSWSISAEWAAYLLFPVLFYAASWERRRWLALAGFSALFLLAFWLFSGNRMLPISSDHDVLTDRIADYGVLRILFEFPLGVAAWNIYRTNRSQNASVMITIVSIGAAAVAMSTPMKGGEAVAVLCFPFILVGVATLERFRAVPVLSHPWVIYGGEISYSIYMVHALVRTCVTALVSIGHIHNPQLEEGLHLGAIGITVALSVATYKWIECPCRKWIARFAR